MNAIQLFYNGDAVTYNGEGLYYFLSALDIPAVRVSGDMAVEADLPLPSIFVFGGFAVEGDISIPVISVRGKTQDVANGSIVLHGTQVDGFIGISAGIVADLSLPRINITGYAQAECNIDVHQLRIAGLFTQYGIAECSVGLPNIFISGVFSAVAGVVGSIKIPAAVIAGEILRPAAQLSCEFSIPIPTIKGRISLDSAFVYPSEDDVIIRYSTGRRYI